MRALFTIQMFVVCVFLIVFKCLQMNYTGLNTLQYFLFKNLLFLIKIQHFQNVKYLKIQVFWGLECVKCEFFPSGSMYVYKLTRYLR